MRTYLKAIKILSFRLAFQQVQATTTSADTPSFFTEKRCRSTSKSEINLNLVRQKPPVQGPRGAIGVTGPAFMPVYVTAFQREAKDCGILPEGTLVTVPFSTIDYARGGALDSATDTFTLPKGVYAMSFFFVIKNEKSQGSFYTFDPLYLDIGGSQLNLAYTVAGYFTSSGVPFSSFYGSTIFEVPEDNTQIALRFQIKTALPEEAFIFVDLRRDSNYPTRIVFQKIGALA